MKTLVAKFLKLSLPALIMMCATSPSFARSRKQIDVDKLQKKYWRAKDYKTGVVQGRKYSKSKKFRVSLEHMNLLNDKYSETDGFANMRGEVSYFINERLSFGGFYENMDLADNTVLRETRSAPNGQFVLDHVKATNFVGASLEFVPIYSKMSWMNDKIIYFDLSISPKVGLVSYEQQLLDESNPEESSFFVGVDLAANIFLSKTTSVSIAYRTRFFQSEVVSYTDASQVVNDSETNFYNFLSLGLNFYL